MALGVLCNILTISYLIYVIWHIIHNVWPTKHDLRHTLLCYVISASTCMHRMHTRMLTSHRIYTSLSTCVCSFTHMMMSYMYVIRHVNDTEHDIIIIITIIICIHMVCLYIQMHIIEHLVHTYMVQYIRWIMRYMLYRAQLVVYCCILWHGFVWYAIVLHVTLSAFSIPYYSVLYDMIL